MWPQGCSGFLSSHCFHSNSPRKVLSSHYTGWCWSGPTPDFHRPDPFLVPLARMGRAGSSSSVPSSSPSLSLSDERAGPGDSIDGASCLSPGQGGHVERRLNGGRGQPHGSLCEKQVLRDTEPWNSRSRARRRCREITRSHLYIHHHLPISHTLFSPVGSSRPLRRRWSLLLAPSLMLAQLSQTLSHADGHLRAQAPHKYAAAQSHRVG